MEPMDGWTLPAGLRHQRNRQTRNSLDGTKRRKRCSVGGPWQACVDVSVIALAMIVASKSNARLRTRPIADWAGQT